MDWRTIDSAPIGTRVRLGHEQDPSSMKVDGLCKAFGEWANGRWELSSFFRVPGGRFGMLCEEPTHWLPERPTT